MVDGWVDGGGWILDTANRLERSRAWPALSSEPTRAERSEVAAMLLRMPSKRCSSAASLP